MTTGTIKTNQKTNNTNTVINSFASINTITIIRVIYSNTVLGSVTDFLLFYMTWYIIPCPLTWQQGCDNKIPFFFTVYSTGLDILLFGSFSTRVPGRGRFFLVTNLKKLNSNGYKQCDGLVQQQAVGVLELFGRWGKMELHVRLEMRFT